MTDLLQSMIPADLPPDEEETLRARLGLVQTTPVQAFRGGYAESEEEQEQRAKPHGERKQFVSKAQRGLKDTILTLPIAERDELLALIHTVRTRHPDLASSGEAVLLALRAYVESAG